MRRPLIFLCFQFAISAMAQVNVPVQKYLDELQHNKYDVVYDEIQNLRKNTRYAKSPTLDYLEAKCLCMNGSIDDAFTILGKMLQSNQFSIDEKKFLRKEMANCGPGTAVPTGVATTAVSKPFELPRTFASFYGKLGEVANCYDYNQFVNFSAMPSPEALQSRIFDKKQKSAALKKWDSILNKSYQIDTVSDRFVVITPLKTDAAKIAAAVAKLQNAAGFYSRRYSLSPPDKLITVFMMPDIAAIQAVSKKIHGVTLPSTNLGYSSQSDLTLVGISDIDHIGTLYHELFHLMIRADIGDIPVWLDEGLACLYATSTWQGDELLGDYNNWRTDVLRNVRASRDYAVNYPSIKLLTSYTSDEFNGADDHNICEASVNYAMANHLMLYFQEKGLLQKIVSAYRNRSIIDLKNKTPYMGNIAVLENAIEQPIDSLGKYFSAWMQKKYSLYVDYKQKKSSVYTFDEILHDHYQKLHFALTESGHRDTLKTFDKQIDLINQAYAQRTDTADIKRFYKAEENRIHGKYDPFVDTDKYTELKEFYDKALDVEYSMRKAIFF